MACSSSLQAQSLDFARDVRPILANHCWSCHGFDETSRGGGLRLDLRDAATAPLKNGRIAIVPGKPEDSVLVQRLFHDKPARHMPPPDFKKPITEEQRQLLKRWIAEGAPYTQHWAFVAPRRPDLPAVKDAAWPINPIDHFLLARLEKEGLRPSPPAKRETLLRRASLDLTGLPPTLADLEMFLADPSSDAYEKAVDRLLASPRYAEKMAVAWLDAARYADTNGYNNDEERSAWPWRDWVIDAFHKNMPFDQFLVEQLAGDMLPKATVEQRLATAFNRNHGLTTEGGIIEDEYRVEYVADRVHTASTVFLAMSFQCARCHEHKYDPISQKEYYQFFAYFNNIADRTVNYNAKGGAEPLLRVLPTSAREQLAKIESRLGELATQLTKRESDIGPIVAAWESQLTGEEKAKLALVGMALHLPLDEGKGEVAGNPRNTTLGTIKGKAKWTDGKFGKALDFDGATFVDLGVTGALDSNAPFTITAWIYPTAGDGNTILSKIDEQSAYRGYDFLVEAGGKLASHLVHHWPDDGLKVITKNPISLNAWHHVALTYDGSQKAAGVKILVDGQSQPLDVPKDKLKGSLASSISFHLGKRGHSLPFKGKIDDVRIYHHELRAEDIARIAKNLNPGQDIDMLSLDPKKRSEPQKAQVQRFYLNSIDELSRKLRAEQTVLRKQQAEIDKQAVQTMVMKDLPTRRATFILNRGEYDKKGDKVAPGIPAVFPPLAKDAPADRLGLARWLVRPDHPLTARVAVNRWWASYFGVGIVETVEDFGMQGELPSHPELLDWLATELIRTGWNVKAMQKLIVTSAAYRQSSRLTPELAHKDPKNRLLARSPRYRLPAEMVRDNALAISGLLKAKVGGPSVKPYQPAGLWEEVSVERRYKYVPDKGEGLYRRSMYTFWRRTCAPPGMTTFDAPDRETCVARRARTNTPLQALILLNDPTYVEAARVLAERMIKASPTQEERLNHGFKLALSRLPTEVERNIIASLLSESMKRYAADPMAAQKALAVGESPRDASLRPTEAAAWMDVASLILNLDETISRP